MKILLCHNYYQQRGGEDQSFEDEAWLLESRGHDVLRYTVHNDVIQQMSRWDVARRSVWNGETFRQLRELLRRERPDIMHCTNTFPLISPAAHSAARAEGVPIVQSLRNYRLLCPNALFMRGGRVCEDCLGKKLAWPSVLHGCYRDSRAASAVVATMLGVHRAKRTWTRSVDLFYTLTDFARQKFVEGKMPAERIVVKPNFVHPDPEPGAGRGGYAVFIGRLSQEKGIDTLLAAWSQPDIGLPLKIIGDGPLAEKVKAAAESNPAIQWLGRRPLDEALSIIGDATLLVMPSVWYETFGRTIIEAFAKGTPVIASKLGAMAELVDDGRTGLHFEPGNAADLATKIRQMLADPIKLANLRRAARHEYERKYTAEPNYRMLMAIYVQAAALHGLERTN
jgi:glycosyltransferase involved in cell wall biosynthesis